MDKTSCFDGYHLHVMLVPFGWSVCCTSQAHLDIANQLCCTTLARNQRKVEDRISE